MNWRYATEINGTAAGWSEAKFATERLALAAGRAMYDGAVWTAWVLPQSYAAQLPHARMLLADMNAAAAERGADTSSFDGLAAAQVDVLDRLLRKSVENWEAWLASAGGAGSSVVLVEHARRHEPVQAAA